MSIQRRKKPLKIRKLHGKRVFMYTREVDSFAIGVNKSYYSRLQQKFNIKIKKMT